MLQRSSQKRIAIVLRIAILAALWLAFPVISPIKFFSVKADNHIIYVNDNVSGGANNGASWANAFSKLRDALAVAEADDEIWVAAGIYYPDEGNGVINNDIVATFQMESGVAIYGGFAGTETQRSQRNVESNITVLSGDIDQNDLGRDANGILHSALTIDGNNSYHVVTAFLVTTAVLDGLVITAGDSAKTNSDFCVDGVCGGGLYATSSSLTLRNVKVIGNKGNYGGGMVLLEASTPSLTDVFFSGNHAPKAGGGLIAQSGADITLTRVTFEDNTSDGRGGGALLRDVEATLDDVDFIRNWAEEGGGLYNWNASPTIQNATFTENRGYKLFWIEEDYFIGGGMYNYQSHPELTNVEFTGNRAEKGGAIYNYQSNPMLDDVQFTGNLAERVVTQVFRTYPGGGTYNENSSPEFRNVTFTKNRANGDGGGMYNFESSNAILTNVTFSGNVATNDGAGMHNSSSSPILTNVIFSGNMADYAGGMSNSNSSPTLTNVTFSGNVAAIDGGGMYNGSNSNPKIQNSIAWNNTANNISNNISNNASTPSFHHSLVEGLNPPGSGNLDGANPANNPLFVRPVNCGADGCTDDPATPNEDESENDDYGDLRLQAGSPAIDAGDNTLLPVDAEDIDSDNNLEERLPVDLAGETRVTAVKSTTAVVDLGAYERQNSAPVAHAGGPYSALEGESISLNASASSDEASIVSYAWDCTNNGSVEATATSPTGNSCTYADDGAYTLRLTVKDVLNAEGTGTAQVTVSNVDPEYTPPPSQSTFVGSNASFLLGEITDPGDEESWIVTVNWGDSSAPEELTVDEIETLPTMNHTYAAQGTFNVVVTVNDGEGDDIGGFQVVVNPASVGGVAGIAFADSNGNGAQEENEAGVAGAELTLQSVGQAGAANVSQTRTATTSATGNYSFNNVPPGEYTLTIVAPSGYVMLGNSETTLTVTAGQITTAPGFTLQQEGGGGDEESVLLLPAIGKP